MAWEAGRGSRDRQSWEDFTAEMQGDNLMHADFSGNPELCIAGWIQAVTKAVDSDGELKVRPIEGILALCDALNGNEVIQELNLASTGLVSCSAKSLAQILPTMT